MEDVKRALILFLSSVIFLLFPVAVFAGSMPAAVRLEKSEVIDTDYFAAGDSVTVSGTVNGDVYVAGGTVLVDGIVNGDLLAAGGTIRITGQVLNDIRVAGGTITIDAPIGGNITVAAGTFMITPEAAIEGSILAGAGTMELLSPVGRDIRAGAESVTLSGTVTGDTFIAAEELTLGENTLLDGNLTYWSEQEFSASANATVAGQTLWHETPKQEKPDIRKAGTTLAGIGIGLKIAEMLFSFLVGALLISLLPVFSRNATQHMKKLPWKSMGVGFLTLAILPIVAISLLLTVIGIPLAVLLIVLGLLLLYVAKLYAALFVGQLLLGWANIRENPYIALATGLVALTLLLLIPLAGWISAFLIFLVALGGVLAEKKRVFGIMRLRKLV